MANNRSIPYRRAFSSQAVTLGSQYQMRSPLGRNIRSFFFRLTGTMTFAAAATQVGRACGDIIKNIQIKRDGETIAELPGATLAFRNWKRPNAPSVVSHTGAIATQSVEMEGYLDFANFGGLRPKDSDLTTDRTQDLLLYVTMANGTDMYSIAPSATALNLEVVAIEHRELALAQPTRGQRGDEINEISRPSHIRKQRSRTIALTGGASTSILLDKNKIFEALTLDGRGATTPFAAINGLASIRVRVGTDSVIELSGDAIREAHANEMGFTPATGIYICDFGYNDGGVRSLLSGLDTATFREDVYLDITNLPGANMNWILDEVWFEPSGEA